LYSLLGSVYDISATYHLQSDPVFQYQRMLGKQWKALTFSYNQFSLEDYFKDYIPFLKRLTQF